MHSKQFDSFIKRLHEATTITSQANLAKVLGISRAAITQAKGNDSIPIKWVTELSRLFNVNPDWLAKGTGPKILSQNSYHEIFQQVPKVKARLSAGGGSFETEPEIEEFYSFRKDWLSKKGQPKDMVLMDIFGNSMEPELKDGDTVLIDQSQKAVLAGAIYAAGLADTIVVKRLEKRPKELVLLSENERYPVMRIRDEEMNSVRIIGKVIWVCRELN
ncbi:MAG: transcriptional regulator [bacterium]|nr:transcriptional regulator [bacterium]